MIIRKRVLMYPSLKNRVAPATRAVPVTPNLDAYTKIVCESDREKFELVYNAQKNKKPLLCVSSNIPPKEIGYIIEDNNGELFGVPSSKLKEFMEEKGEFLTDFNSPIYIVIYEDKVHMCAEDVEDMSDDTLVFIYESNIGTTVTKRVQVGPSFNIKTAKGIHSITAKGDAVVCNLTFSHPELIDVLSNEVVNVSGYRANYGL